MGELIRGVTITLVTTVLKPILLVQIQVQNQIRECSDAIKLKRDTKTMCLSIG